jgi:hypothetical protein
MTIKELIKELGKYDENTVVTVREYDGSDEMCREIIKIAMVPKPDYLTPTLKKQLNKKKSGAIYLTSIKNLE